jgi:endogenous inhibitor of DNA gyrase (YacG/DUF329 family)
LTTHDARCFYCRHKPVDPAWKPFCSERCKMTDLGRWLREEYRAPTEPVTDDSEAEDGG